MINNVAKNKARIDKWPGEPRDSYPLERPDKRVLVFELKRIGRTPEETKKQQCQVEASPLTVEFTRSVVYCDIPGLHFVYILL